MADVLLVCMPFGPVFSPSLGLSLLKAGLAAKGIPARVRYFSIDFAERTGQAFYCDLASEGRPSVRDLAGEWIFSGALFPATEEEEEAYVEEVLRKRSASLTDGAGVPASPALIGRILRARRAAPGFLERCLEEVVRERPRLVGFTSVFQQHLASLALARRLKQALPDAFIVMGGANCEAVMGAETVRQFPFVDAAVSGEADRVFPELARRVLDSRSLGGLPGVRTREGTLAEFASGSFSSAPMVRDLDELPYPDYADYFEQFEASRYGREWQPSLLFETSRGCWWGERMHCTFCGLNGQTMAYRSKSARRALDELLDLTREHPGCDVEVSDNILDLRYFKDFLPELAVLRPGIGLYYETKANLRKEQVRLLRDAGIKTLQPGIESFSDTVLKLMRKGVSGLQNIQILKWCKELGIEPYWNLLWGFPGEPPEEYTRMASLVPLLTHLPLPVGFGSIRLDRFSPNFFDAERLGFTDIAPLPAYRHLYRLPAEARANLAYYFSFAYREPRDVESYVRPLLRELRAWRRVAGRSDLFSVDLGECLLLWDLRPAARRALTVLGPLDRLLHQACDAACGVQQLAQAVERPGGGAVPPEEIERRLEPLVASGLLVRDGSRYLALAVPLGEYGPPPRVLERFYEIARRLGRHTSRGVVIPLDGAAPPPAHKLGARARPFCPRPARGRPRRGLSASGFSLTERGELLIRGLPRT